MPSSLNTLQAQALAKATQVRSSRAALHTHLKHMPPQEARQIATDLIHDTPDWLNTQLTIKLLQQIPYVAAARSGTAALIGDTLTAVMLSVYESARPQIMRSPFST